MFVTCAMSPEVQSLIIEFLATSPNSPLTPAEFQAVRDAAERTLALEACDDADV